jgi:hypothetical protein
MRTKRASASPEGTTFRWRHIARLPLAPPVRACARVQTRGPRELHTSVCEADLSVRLGEPEIVEQRCCKEHFFSSRSSSNHTRLERPPSRSTQRSRREWRLVVAGSRNRLVKGYRLSARAREPRNPAFPCSQSGLFRLRSCPRRVPDRNRYSCNGRPIDSFRNRCGVAAQGDAGEPAGRDLARAVKRYFHRVVDEGRLPSGGTCRRALHSTRERH